MCRWECTAHALSRDLNVDSEYLGITEGSRTVHHLHADMSRFVQLPAASVLLPASVAACLFQLHVLATCAKPCESQQPHGLRHVLTSHALHCTVQFEWLHCVGQYVLPSRSA